MRHERRPQTSKKFSHNRGSLELTICNQLSRLVRSRNRVNGSGESNPPIYGIEDAVETFKERVSVDEIEGRAAVVADI